MRSALVTGATGFIGSALVRCLAERGTLVHAVGPAGDPRWATLAGGAQVRRHALPVLTRAALVDAVGQEPPELVFHLASYGVHPSDRDPRRMLEGNVGLLVEVIDAAAAWGVRRLVFTGSCSEYGPIAAGVALDEGAPRRAEGLYGAAKAAAFDYGRVLANQLGLPLITLRLFGVYGPGEAPHRLVPYLVQRLRAGQRVDLTPGKQVRDMLFIDDLVEALVLGATAPGLSAGCAYNVCSGLPVRIRDLCSGVARLLGAPENLLEFGARPYRPDEPMWLLGNPSRFLSVSGWSPRVGLDEGLARTVEQLKERRTA